MKTDKNLNLSVNQHIIAFVCSAIVLGAGEYFCLGVTHFIAIQTFAITSICFVCCNGAYAFNYVKNKIKKD